MRPLDPRLLRIAAPARRYLAVCSALGVAVAALVLVQAWCVADVVARVEADPRSATVRAVAVPLVVLLGAVLIRAGCSGLQETAGRRAASQVQAELRARLLTHSAALGRRARGTVGARATLATRGLDALEPYLARFLPQVVLASVVPLVVLVQIAWIDWVSGALVAVTLPLIPVFMVLVGLHTRKETRKQWRTLSVLSGHFLDVVQGLPTLKVFGRAKAQTDLIRTVSDEHRVATDRTLRTAFLSAFVLELAATLSVAVVAVGIGLRLLDGRLDLRTALVVLILAPEAYLPIRNVGAAFHSSAEGVEAVDAVLVVLEQPLPDRSGHYLPGAGAVRVDAEQVAIDGGTDRAFRLPPTDVHAAAGETVAVLGPTGCGKSSLLEAILGTAEVADGRLTVDGHPVRGLDRTAWHSCVAWLPQRPLLFAGTVADNVRFGEPDATDDEVSAALVAAGAADVLAGLPGGTGSLVGEGGAGLSAGQRQRVAVARVLLRITRRDPRLVLLDEPTAHLDAATEATVLAGLAAACAGRTTILVTHRSAATGIAHRVLQVAPTSTPVEPVPA